MGRALYAVQRILGLSGIMMVSFVCSWLGAYSLVHAQHLQTVEITASPNPVGSGARALGMGGAFIAVADDATAASWNPGGLTQLERPEISVVGAFFQSAEDLRFDALRRGSGTQSLENIHLNYLSAALPLEWAGFNAVVSLNYQHLYDFNREWNYRVRDRWSDVQRRYREDGALYAWGLASCVQILPELSLGFTLNFWEDGLFPNGWETTYFESGSVHGIGRFKAAKKESYEFSGFNGNVGILWNALERLTVGAVFKSPFEADLEHENSAFSKWGRGTGKWAGFRREEQLRMPLSYGMGAGYRVSDFLILSADIYRTHWEGFLLALPGGATVSPVSGLPEEKSSIAPTTQVRVGGEFLFIKPRYVVPLRAGFFYDPVPAEKSPDAFYGLTIGSGIGFDRFTWDIAYQFRFGGNVGSSILRDLEFTEDVRQHTVMSSLIVYF